jgi:hypothetical protein
MSARALKPVAPIPLSSQRHTYLRVGLQAVGDDNITIIRAVIALEDRSTLLEVLFMPMAPSSLAAISLLMLTVRERDVLGIRKYLV